MSRPPLIGRFRKANNDDLFDAFSSGISKLVFSSLLLGERTDSQPGQIYWTDEGRLRAGTRNLKAGQIETGSADPLA